MNSWEPWEQLLRHLTESLHAANIDDTSNNFRQRLTQMPRAELNHLDMGRYNRAERRLIDEERVRRSRATTGFTAINLPIQGQAQASSSSTNTSTFDSGNGQSSSSAGQPFTPPIEKPERWYLFPEHHAKVAEKVKGARFNPSDIEGDEFWDTNIVGRFKCSNTKCSKVWTSGVVATRIRKYGQSPFRYNARVYNQGCRRCKKLGIMEIDIDAYVERVVRRVKIWKGEAVPVVNHPGADTEREGPHLEDLCEGCKAGHCPYKRLALRMFE
ncbi:hypothetical protein Dda_1068 [Drechslerella dactyloides]|uniref:3CxxC-type domain-containing protein n=1 Tax=Drechslerella dactyloides TaxID=74499 RepID=A0AAD6J7B7_DREDA|nr:hypothetical protein Dda_1068 [Drechslerella dactyloides]